MPLFRTFFLVLLFTTSVFAEQAQYNIVASYDEATHEIDGYEEITFTNGSLNAVSELHLLLYPNLYREKQPGLSRAFYRKAYPVGFNSGGIDIQSIEDMRGTRLSFFPDSDKKNMRIKIKLPKPILPMEQYKFVIRFVTKIPQKWGHFGYYEDLVVLQGGWHPYLAAFAQGEWGFNDPPEAGKYRIEMKLKEGLQLIGSSPSIKEQVQGKGQTFLFEGDDLSFFSLSIGRDFVEYNTKVENISIRYHALSRDQSYAKKVIQVTELALSYFLARTEVFPETHLEFASAGLYQNLTSIGTNLLYINHRVFKVFPTLKRFHEAGLAYGLYRLLWRKKRPEEAWWVIECLAKIDAESFMKSRHGKAFNLAEWLKPIAFIPLIDQILYSEDLPMRQVYFREAAAPTISEDIRFYNNPPSENPNIFSKLKSLLGEEIMDRVILSYIMQDRSEKPVSFREVLSQTTGRDLKGLIDQWLNTRLKIDYALLGVHKSKVNDTHETSIQIGKNGKGIEPLQILVQEENGTRIPLVWDGIGSSHQIDLKTQSPIESVELDPHKLSNDPNRFNNRSPHAWKFLLDEFAVNYDFQTRFLSYRAGLLFQRLYDHKNWIRLLFSQTDSSDFAHLSYSHTIKPSHILTTGLTYETIGEDLAFGRQAEEAGFLSLTYAFIFSDIPLLTEALQRLTTTFPKLSAALTYNQEFTDDAYENSFLLNLGLRRQIVFSNYHEIAGKLIIGQSIGKLFEESRFYLGGVKGMRGYTPLAFEGENIALYSLEYRFPLFYETNINFMGLLHSHTWQGALFADTGMVNDEHNVFQFEEFKSDVGVGIRFFVDLFGVYPAILRADVAVPIASPIEDEQKPHYYLNVGQSF